MVTWHWQWKVSALSSNTDRSMDHSRMKWLTAWRALVIDPMDQLVCLTNNQLTCSTIDGTKVAYLCSSIECPNKCVRWSRRRYHDQNEAHQQAPTGTERWVTQVSKGVEWNDANWRAARISIGIEDANWWEQRRLESTWLMNGSMEHPERWNSLNRVEDRQSQGARCEANQNGRKAMAFRCQAWSRVNER